MILKQAGLKRSELVNSVANALPLLQKTFYSLVFVDLELPRAEVKMLVEEIRRLSPLPPHPYIRGIETDSSIENCVRHGVDAIIGKKADYLQVLEVVSLLRSSLSFSSSKSTSLSSSTRMRASEIAFSLTSSLPKIGIFSGSSVYFPFSNRRISRS